MKKPWLLVAWLLVIELLAILLLIPGDWTDRAIKRESVLVEQSLGVEARDWIQNKASTWFRSSVIDSGFYEGMYQTLIPSEEERQKSKGMQDMGKGWFVWVKGRMEAFVNVIYQFYTRFVVVKFFWTRRSDGRVMHRRATGRQGWPAFRTVRVIGSQVLNAIGYCYKS
ncbi:DUF4400 domain-containing protein (plasmid) [Klebsiella pneumoniae subsp. pneumoniae]|uniref:DUF4400 domain-containing protein n=1 Tax=Klebsiella pneumoniae TaxID=573 RepID=UPI00351844AB